MKMISYCKIILTHIHAKEPFIIPRMHLYVGQVPQFKLFVLFPLPYAFRAPHRRNKDKNGDFDRWLGSMCHQKLKLHYMFISHFMSKLQRY